MRARLERFLSPGLGRCYRCDRPWKFPASIRVGWRTWQQLDHDRFFGLVGVEPHSTSYTESKACFPLCEGCWSALTPEERLPYYDELWISWLEAALEYPDLALDLDEKRYEQIREAVLAGA